MSWLLVGLIAGLVLGLVIGTWRRRARETSPRPGDEPSAPAIDHAYAEAVWSLRVANRRVDAVSARLLASDARRLEAERHADLGEDDRDELQDTLRALSADLENSQRERDAAEDRLAEAETRLGQSAAIIARLEAEQSQAVARSDAELSGAVGRIRALEAALESAHSRAEATAIALGETDRRASLVRDRADRVETDLVEARREAERLALAVRGFEEEATRRKAEAATLEDAAQAAEDRAGRLRTRVTQIEGDLDDARAAAQADARLTDRLLTEVEEGSARDAATVEERDAARQEADSLRMVIVSLRRQIEEYGAATRGESASRARISELEHRLTTVTGARRSEVDRLTLDLDRSRRAAVVSDDRADRVRDLEATLGEERRKRLDAEEAAESLASRSAGLEDRLRAGADELRELDALRTRHDAVRRSLVDARDSLEALAGTPAAQEIDRLRTALRSERDRAMRFGTRTGSAPPDETAILRLRIVELEDLIARLEVAQSGPDDLTLVRGIGPVIRNLLAEEGIVTFSQLARIDDATLDRVRSRVPVYPERIERDRWIEQAAALTATQLT